MLDAEAVISVGATTGTRVRVEHKAVGVIANGVGGNLPARRKRATCNRFDLLLRRHDDAGFARIVCVGRVERRAAGTERTVGVKLDTAQFKKAKRATRSRRRI